MKRREPPHCTQDDCFRRPRSLTGRFTPSPNHSFFPNQSYLLIGSFPYLRSGIFPTHPQPSIITACPERWNRHRVPKRRLIYFGRRGNSQKNTYYIQNTAKAWKLPYFKLLVQNSWWWKITCSKRVEDKLSEINYYEKCAFCWSFSRCTRIWSIILTTERTWWQVAVDETASAVQA